MVEENRRGHILPPSPPPGKIGLKPNMYFSELLILKVTVSMVTKLPFFT